VAARASDRTDAPIDTNPGTQMEDVLAWYRRRIKLARMPQRIRREARRQLTRLATFPFGSFEHYMVRGYLEAIIEMPWPERVASEQRLLAAVLDS
jgi:ATP-dependent Lon protease